MAALCGVGIVQSQHFSTLRVNKAGKVAWGERHFSTTEATRMRDEQWSLGLPERLVDALGRVNESAHRRIHRYRVYRASVLELSKLSDRDLADLGLRRGMIRSLAREAARRA